jgi:uncharacterized protein involved in outer membrane biogenesis
MKILRRLLAVALILLLAAIAALLIAPGPITRQAIQRVGSEALGVAVTCEAAQLSLGRGRLGVDDLRIANPEGFSDQPLARIGRIEAALRWRSLFSPRIELTEVVLTDADFRFELGLQGHNFGRLLKQVRPPPAAGTRPPAGTPAPAAPKKPQAEKSLVIDELRIETAVVHASFGEAEATMSLPAIRMTGLGDPNAGLRPAELARRVLRAVLDAILETVKTGDGSGVEGLKDLLSEHIQIDPETKKALKETGRELKETLRDLFR